MASSSLPDDLAKGQVNYLNASRGFMSWATSTDHKRIGLMYGATMGVFFSVAVLLAVLMRLELLEPGMQIFSGFPGVETDADARMMYNRVLTLHGVAMIFLFIIPGVPAVFGNFALPIQIGARDVIFPRLNLASYYFFVAGAGLALASVLIFQPDTGWTFYAPYSAHVAEYVTVPMLAAFLLGWSSILTGINFIATVHRMRAKGMGWFDMPLFVWSIYATGWVQVIATPVVGITLLMVLAERHLGIPFFDPTIGGDPILFEHLFWIYSHPAVYVMILPAMGVVSEVVAASSRKRIFGYHFVAFSSLAIAGLGSLVWAHHMFTSGMQDNSRILFSFLTFFIAVPSAVKVFNWLSTMYRGSVKLDPPMLWVMSFIFLFSIGGFTGLYAAALALDIHLHDTSFVVAHFHYTMFGGAGVMIFAACHYWWPKMFGRMYSKKVANLSCGLFFIGFNATYLPLFLAGINGMPRRYADYLVEYEGYHRMSTHGSWLLATSLFIMALNLIYGIFWGPKAPANPWGAMTLEWTSVQTPPITLNFAEDPVVTGGAYNYPEAVQDFDEVTGQPITKEGQA